MTEVKPKAGEKGYIGGWEVQQKQISQAQADYDPYGAKNGKGCATCHWFVSPNSCVLVSGDIASGGISDLYTAPVQYESPPIRVTIVDQIISKEKEKETKPGVLATIVSSIKTKLGLGAKGLEPITFYRKEDGSMAFFMVYSNPFKDKHGEILSDASHKEYADWTDENPDALPEVHIWHGGPATAIGKADVIGYSNGFAIAAGHIYKEREADAEKLATQKLGVSHGFIGVKKEKDWYSVYRSFELTVLPRPHEANIWTDVELVSKETELALTDKKKAFFKDVMGWDDAKLASVETGLSEQSANLKALGIEWKEEGETDTTKPEGEAKAPEGAAAEKSADVTLAHLKEVVNAMQTTSTVVTGISASVKSLNETVTGLVAEVAKLKQSDDEKIAAHYKAELAQNPGGHVASASADNHVDPSIAAKKKEGEDLEFVWGQIDSALKGASVS